MPGPWPEKVRPLVTPFRGIYSFPGTGLISETFARKGETFGLTFPGGGQVHDRGDDFYTDALNSHKSGFARKLGFSESAPHRWGLVIP